MEARARSFETLGEALGPEEAESEVKEARTRQA